MKDAFSPKPAVTLDLSGVSCPGPIIGAKKIVDDMEIGQTMLLISDCPGTPDDLLAWARHTGNDVTSAEKLEGGRTAYLIPRGGGRKAAPKANVTLDMRGATCPGPILEAKKVLDGMQSGEMLMLAVSYTHLRAHETVLDLVCRLLLEKKKK